MALRKARKHRSGGWAPVGLLAVTAGCLTAVGCGPEFEACTETRTCAPASEGGGGAGGEPAAQADSGASGASEVEEGCGTGTTSCDEECVDVAVSVDHCGACGVACDASATCRSGSCVACPKGQLGCDGTCVDPGSDTTFCGAAERCTGEDRGLACNAQDVCQAGVCVSDSAALQSLTLAPATLSPKFDSERLQYTASFPFYTQHLTLAAVAASPAATVSASGTLLSADGIVLTPTPEEELQSLQVDVTAQSGTERSYELALERAPLTKTYVKPFNTRAGFHFGSSVAIDGDTVVVGAPDEDGYATGVDGDDTVGGTTGAASGAAYVLVRGSSGKWARQAYLKADHVFAGAGFGASVAVSGDTIAVGAPRLRNESGDPAGAVFIFAREGSSWAQQAVLKGRAENGWFGSVALSGEQLVASAPRSGFVQYEGGALFSYTRRGVAWEMDAKHPNPPSSDLSNYTWFGYRLGFSGDRVVASGEQLSTVFVLLRSGGTWAVEQPISLPGGALSKANVALDGDTLALSAPGVVHVFTRAGSEWIKQASLSPFDADAADGFGSSLALEGDLLVVGSGCADCRGAFSTFVRAGETWKDGAFVPTAQVEAGDAHGAAVAVSGTSIVVGAPGEDSSARGVNQSAGNNASADSGAAYIYE